MCEDKLLVLFNDENEDIQKCSATCFQSLEEKPVGDFEKLIEGFCRSRAFETDSSELIELLVQSTYRVPGVLASTCERYLTWFEKRSETGARDLAYGVSMKLVSQLIFRIYQQHKGDVWGTKALDLIDRMCLVGVSEVRGGLSEFDR